MAQAPSRHDKSNAPRASRDGAHDPPYRDGDTAVGVPVVLADGLGVGLGLSTNGNFNALKSGLLSTNVPSRSSVRANHMLSPVGPPTISLCVFLSSGEVVNVIVT